MTSVIKTTRPQFLMAKVTGGSGTTNANNTRAVTLDVSRSGYTPLGIVGATTYHGSILLQEFYLDGTTAHLIMRNVTSSAYTNSIAVWVLYVKND